MMRIVKKYIVLLAAALFVIPLHAQYKVVESSSKKAPSWIGVSQADYIIVSAEGESLDDAKVKCLEYIKQSVITSVAVNISSTEKFSESVEMVGDSMNANRKYESEIEYKIFCPFGGAVDGTKRRKTSVACARSEASFFLYV